MSGWWGSYSFRCQPVDYSNNPMALRVSLCIINYLVRSYTENTAFALFCLCLALNTATLSYAASLIK